MSGLFPVADPAYSAKGRHWMRALQRQVADVWTSTIETNTTLCRVHGLEAEAEVVAISAAFAVTAARVLDLEVLQAEHGSPYVDAKRATRLGQVVDGLVLIRNAEIHLPVILDPDPDRVLSLLHRAGGQQFRVLPKWRPYTELPADVRESTRTSGRCHAAYRSAVQGESIVETLLDALAWFMECDGTLARRDEEGELEGFPLPELWQHDYERRHPDWRSRREVESELRAAAAEWKPVGDYRAIRHRLDGVDDAAMSYCGYTRTATGGQAFTETPAQIALDVLLGFVYVIEPADADYLTIDLEAATKVTMRDDTLVVDDTPLSDLALRPFTDEHPSASTWQGWFDLVNNDAFQYAQQRKAGT